jgi:alkanesulfonate monooxygenase SsuD/methylene tetrahydromethanopterin reductase-like flavin-dependent oxidoreductase (luciferase family)
MVQVLEAACGEIGRDPSAIRRTWIGGCACAPTRAEAVALAGDRWSADDEEDFGFVGTPSEVLEQMMPFVRLGVDYFMFDCGGFPELTTIDTILGGLLPMLGNTRT